MYFMITVFISTVREKTATKWKAHLLSWIGVMQSMQKGETQETKTKMFHTCRWHGLITEIIIGETKMKFDSIVISALWNKRMTIAVYQCWTLHDTHTHRHTHESSRSIEFNSLTFHYHIIIFYQVFVLLLLPFKNIFHIELNIFWRVIIALLASLDICLHDAYLLLHKENYNMIKKYAFFVELLNNNPMA